jgi:hypothetical protein
MDEDAPWLLYESTVPFEEVRIRAAAIYCSDGRFGEQCDDFLQNALGLPRYDRLAIPGGAACLGGHFSAYREEDALRAQLEFLITAHELSRVILIAHEDCAFYTTFLEASPIGLAELQRDDLVRAADRVRQMAPGVTVEAFLAVRRGGVIGFETVPT